MSRHSLDSLEQPHESPGFAAPDVAIDSFSPKIIPKIFRETEVLPDTVPFFSFQPCVKYFHAGRESELEIKLCSTVTIFLAQFVKNNTFECLSYHSFTIA